jgi:hypothetical protein
LPSDHLKKVRIPAAPAMNEPRGVATGYSKDTARMAVKAAAGIFRD